MAKPSDKNAIRFYRVAYQRFDDAEQLLKSFRPQASIYLSGYAVECILKALLLISTPQSQRTEVLNSFRGAKAHDIEWLKEKLKTFSVTPPSTESSNIVLVSSWSTDLRYEPGPGEYADAEAFLNATKSIIRWADRRM